MKLFTYGTGCLLILLFQVFATAASLPKENKVNPQTEITCKGKLDMDYEKNVAVFHNDVTVEDPRMKMNADLMTVYFEPKEKNIEKVVATGNVRFRKEDKTAKSNQAVYTVKDGKIVLTGQPMVKRDRDVLAGEKITFFRDDNRMLIEPSAKLMIYSSGQNDLNKEWL